MMTFLSATTFLLVAAGSASGWPIGVGVALAVIALTGFGALTVVIVRWLWSLLRPQHYGWWR
jgi:hypothetical protein